MLGFVIMFRKKWFKKKHFLVHHQWSSWYGSYISGIWLFVCGFTWMKKRKERRIIRVCACVGLQKYAASRIYIYMCLLHCVLAAASTEHWIVDVALKTIFRRSSISFHSIDIFFIFFNPTTSTCMCMYAID